MPNAVIRQIGVTNAKIIRLPLELRCHRNFASRSIRAGAVIFKYVANSPHPIRLVQSQHTGNTFAASGMAGFDKKQALCIHHRFIPRIPKIGLLPKNADFSKDLLFIFLPEIQTLDFVLMERPKGRPVVNGVKLGMHFRITIPDSPRKSSNGIHSSRNQTPYHIYSLAGKDSESIISGGYEVFKIT